MSKLDYRNLEILPEWQVVKGHIQALIKDYTEDMISRAGVGDVNMVLNLGGRVSALQEVLTLPEAAMPGNPKSEIA